MVGEFFKGWRRKIGVLTLVAALAAMGLWLRGIVCLDVLWVEGLGQYHEWVSAEGEVHWIIRDGLWNLDFDWTYWPAKSSQAKNVIENYLVKSKQYARRPGTHAFVWTIPILPLVVSLIMASAYLLFSKPRISTPKKINESIPAEGT